MWGNVIWYGIGGWASCGTGGRGINADFFLYALLCSVRTVSRAVANSSCPHSACTSSPQHSSYRSSSSRTNHRLLFLFCSADPARLATRSPAACCCSRPTSLCLRPGTSCAAATTRYPSRTSTWQQTRSYSLPPGLALPLAGRRRPESRGRVSSRVRFGSQTSTCRRSHEHLRTSQRARGPGRRGIFLPLLLPAKRIRCAHGRRRLQRSRVSRDWTGRCSCESPD